MRGVRSRVYWLGNGLDALEGEAVTMRWQDWRGSGWVAKFEKEESEEDEDDDHCGDDTADRPSAHSTSTTWFGSGGK